MPIAGITPTTSDEKVVSGIDPEVQTAVVVDVDDTIADMVRYVDGAEWAVDYYTLVLGEDDTSSQLDPLIPVPEQQYELIHDLEIRITTPIEATNTNELEGNADIPYGVTVKENDIILATLSTGIRALFIVDEITSKSYNKKKLYNAHFKLLTTEIKGPEYFDTLANKVIREYYYRGGDIEYSGDPILTLGDSQWKDTLEQYQQMVYANFAQEFIGNDIRLPLLDMTYALLYDPHIDALYRRLGDAREMMSLASTPFDLDKITYGTVIDAMFTDYPITSIKLKYIKHFTPSTDRNATYGGRVISNYPLPYGIGTCVNLVTDEESADIQQVENESTSLPALGKEYLFSSNFYAGTGEVSILEKMLNDALDGKYVLREELEPLIKLLPELKPFERYRYSLFIVILIRYARNKINTVREVV